MRKWTKSAAQRLAAIPVPAILFVLALQLFLWGAYACSPWFDSSLVDAGFAHNRLAEFGLGLGFMLIGGLRMGGAGRRNRRLLLAVPYGVMMGYLFLALLRILVVGWYPLTWLPLLICAIVAGICRLALLYGPDRE